MTTKKAINEFMKGISDKNDTILIRVLDVDEKESHNIIATVLQVTEHQCIWDYTFFSDGTVYMHLMNDDELGVKLKRKYDL